MSESYPSRSFTAKTEQFLALMVAHQALADGPRSLHESRSYAGHHGPGQLSKPWHFDHDAARQGAEDALRIIQRFRPELTEEELRAIKDEIKASLPFSMLILHRLSSLISPQDALPIAWI